MGKVGGDGGDFFLWFGAVKNNHLARNIVKKTKAIA